MCRQRHSRSPSWSPARDHEQQHLHPEAVSPIRLEDLQAGIVIEFLAGQCICDVPAHVIVADAPGIRIAMRALSYFCRRPWANSREAAQGLIGLVVRPGQGPL